jgi:hypothetical protein
MANFTTTARVQVRFYTLVSPEADELRRRLQAKLQISANQLAERALRSLALEQGVTADRSQAAA